MDFGPNLVSNLVAILLLEDVSLFDINLFPINLEKNNRLDSLPGLIVLVPPRRSARGREHDILIVMVSIKGAAGITDESLNSWLQKKSESYYKIPGTVTFAMKTLVEALNNDLLERNLKRVKDGSRMSAALNLAVLRRQNLYLVNIGSARAYFAGSSDAVEFLDTETQERGLGVDQMLACQFNQREVTENDVLVISCQPPSFWKAETFSGCGTLSIEAANRRLHDQVSGDLKAVLLRFTPGKGVVTHTILGNQLTLQQQPAETQENGMVVQTTVETVLPIVDVEFEGVKQILNSNPPTIAESFDPEVSQFNPTARISTESIPAPTNAQTAGSQYLDQQSLVRKATVNDVKNMENSKPTDVQVMAGRITRKMVTGVNQTGSFFTRFLQKLMPGLADEPLKLSRRALISVAVGIPLLILFIAGMVYTRAGKSKQFEQNLVLAQQYAMQAEVQVNEPPVRLANLQQSLFWLDKAETYGQSELSATLRVKVQGELDVMQGIQRLEMVEVIPGGLPAGSNVTQIVATANDLYLLDEKSGTVKRYYMGGAGYLADQDFDCGPNPDNPLNMMGKLVDMIPVNVNNQFKATLLAIDAGGNIEFCIPGDAGVTGTLTPPDRGWEKLTSISIFNNSLYILDSGGNAVYRYDGNGVLFENKPVLYFDDQIPNLTEAIDIEVNGDELYILRSNGQMVECSYSPLKEVKLTECDDPALYSDMRTGQVPEAISFPEANFVQMRMTAAPDSSIYLLDTTTKGLYHFSLQMNLQKILHPRLINGVNIDRLTPTAVAISSGRIAFMAFGSQIYYSPLP